jgi:hypothetical protein
MKKLPQNLQELKKGITNQAGESEIIADLNGTMNTGLTPA